MYLPETDPIKHFSWLTFFRFSLLPKLGHFIINNFLYVINTQVSSENLKMKKKKFNWIDYRTNFTTAVHMHTEGSYGNQSSMGTPYTRTVTSVWSPVRILNP